MQNFSFSIVSYRCCYLLLLQERFFNMKGKINFIPIYRFLLFLLLFVFVTHAGLILIHSCGTVSYYTEISDMCSDTRLCNSLYFMSDIEDVMHDSDYSILDILQHIERFECVDKVFETKKIDVNSNDNYTIYIYSSELLELFSQQQLNKYFSPNGLSKQGKIQGVRAMCAENFSPAYFIESGKQVPMEQIDILEQGVFYPRFIINSNQMKFFDLLYTNENAFIVKETPEVMSLLEETSILYDTNLLIVLNDSVDFDAHPDIELKSYLESHGTYVTFDLISKESSDFQNIKFREGICVLIFGILITLLTIVITVFSLKIQLGTSYKYLKIGVIVVFFVAFCLSALSALLCKLFYVLPAEHFYLNNNIYLYLVLLYGVFVLMAMISIKFLKYKTKVNSCIGGYSDGKAIQ